MITKFSTARDEYLVLFEEATNRLNSLGITNSKGELFDYSKGVKIETLEEYFSHLRDLVYGTDASPATDLEAGYRFLKLPVDEPHFIIDANTRKIQVPDEFKKNGVSVLGDEVAEILFFEVDRFYDATDLSQTNIIIQWQAPGSDDIQYTPAFMSIVVHDNLTGDEKLIFGWPISSEITENAGTLSFSVRFYVEDPDDKANAYPIFSLSTLTQTVTINPGLVYSIVGLAPDNRLGLILNKRLQNSPIGQPDPPTIPTIIFSVMGENGIYSKNNVIDYQIPEDGEVTFALLGYKSDSGTLTYSWQRYDKETDTVETLNPNSDFVSPIVDGIYVPVNEYIIKDSGKIATYFSKTPYGEYERHTIDEEEFETLLKEKNGLYVRCSYYTLNAQTIKPGVYFARVKNTLYNESKLDVDVNRVYWEVLGVETPIISEVSWDSDEVVLTDGLALSLVSGENLDISTLQWEKSSDTAIVDSPTNFTPLFNGNNFTPTEEGYYRLKVINSRNNAEKIATTSSVLVLSKVEDFNVTKVQVGNTLTADIGARTLQNFENISYSWSHNSDRNVIISTDATISFDLVGDDDIDNYFVTVTISKGNSLKLVRNA